MPLLFNNLGGVLARRGDLNEAVAEYREGIKIDPANATVHENFGSGSLG